MRSARSISASLFFLGVVTAIAIACGSSNDSTFVDPSLEAGTPPPANTFNPVDASGGDSNAGCVPQTCTTANAECGAIGDGCGNIIQCGSTCPLGQVCSGGGVANKCGAPPCVKKTCADQGIECGQAGDGCGGLIANCGSCEAGICGGGGKSKCGGGVGDSGVCVPTKAACAPGDCGFVADGCGNVIDCTLQLCPAGQACGIGAPAVPNMCGALPCVKATCGAANCGYKQDGCGGILNCWPAAPAPSICGPGQTCGALVPNTCGTPAGCTGLCTQQQACAGGATTSIEGYVTSPNGVLPVPNAVVYVPDGAVAPFGAGVVCEGCAKASSLVSTTTDANGHFFLPNMPVSAAAPKVTDIPVVVQLGRWRKQFTITTTACTNTLVPSVGGAAANKTAALPAVQTATDNIPLTAISTGQVDGLECVFRKMGVADSEFTDGSGVGRIRLYQDNGAAISSGSPKASTLYGTAAEIEKFDAAIFGCVGSEKMKATADLTNVFNYANKGGRVFATHFSYVWLYNKATKAGGGSVAGPMPAWNGTVNTFDPANEKQWNGTAAPGSLSAFVDTSFPKGVLFSTWLQAPVAPVSATYAPPYANVDGLWPAFPAVPSAAAPARVVLTEPRRDITPTAPNLSTSGIVSSATSPVQRWIYATGDQAKACAVAADCLSGACVAKKCVGSVTFDNNDPNAVDAPMHYTFNTPIPAPVAPAIQCGRVLYSDFHVSIGSTNGKIFPAECNNTALTSQEKVLAYMLFDLASCVSSSAPPACVPKSCVDQGLGCGLAGDGCGNQLDCGVCPAGKSCGGGGVPSQCGAPACNPRVCVAGDCGKMGNNCGGQIDCGNCAAGSTCGGGGPNICGVLACNPLVCPAPAAGSACGPVADGCGAVNNCPCAAGVPCVNGTCGAPACNPRTCQQAGANCGQVADGCGLVLDCGGCVAPQTCGGGGVANLCGGGVN
jgi:hypothetical protein